MIQRCFAIVAYGLWKCVLHKDFILNVINQSSKRDCKSANILYLKRPKLMDVPTSKCGCIEKSNLLQFCVKTSFLPYFLIKDTYLGWDISPFVKKSK